MKYLKKKNLCSLFFFNLNLPIFLHASVMQIFPSEYVPKKIVIFHLYLNYQNKQKDKKV